MKTVSKNARNIYNFRNKIINNIKKETGERIDEKEEMKSLDDLLYAGAEKLRQLKMNMIMKIKSLMKTIRSKMEGKH